MIEGMDKVVREHRFFSGLDEDVIRLLSRAARATFASMPASTSIARAIRPTSSF